MTTSFDRRADLAAEITREAGGAYTSGPQRQILDLAAMLLRRHMSAGELADHLARVIAVDMIPAHKERFMALARNFVKTTGKIHTAADANGLTLCGKKLSTLRLDYYCEPTCGICVERKKVL